MTKNTKLLALVALGVGAYFLIKKGSPGSKRADLIAWIDTNPGDNSAAKNAFNAMSETEIAAVHDFIFNYFKKGLTVPAGTPLYNAIDAISTKYNIFT